jgi:hypothetical protein
MTVDDAPALESTSGERNLGAAKHAEVSLFTSFSLGCQSLRWQYAGEEAFLFQYVSFSVASLSLTSGRHSQAFR